MKKLRKPMIRALEAMEQLIEAIRADLGDALIEIRDFLKAPTDSKPKRKGPRKP